MKVRNGDERTPANELRLAVARQIAEVSARDSSVAAVLVTGSTARGQADRWSDLELMVIWESAPGDEQRRRIVADAAGQGARSWAWDENEGACYDEWWHGGSNGFGLLVEVTNTTSVELATRVNALVRGDADLSLLTFGDAIVNGVPLVDHADLRVWRAQLTPYPRELAIAVVRQHGQIDHFWRWQMYLERYNLIQLGVHFAEVVAQVVHMTCALSGVWWPGPKWLTSLASTVSVAPVDFANRLQRISSESPSEAAATLTSLVDETYDLVALHLPEVDVARLREIFYFARHPY